MKVAFFNVMDLKYRITSIESFMNKHLSVESVNVETGCKMSAIILKKDVVIEEVA